MVIVMEAGASEQEIRGVLDYLTGLGLAYRVSRGVERTIAVVLGDVPAGLEEELAARSEIRRVVPIAKPFKLASREYRAEDTVVRVGGVDVGGTKPLLVAGLARVAGAALFDTASAVREAGAALVRVPAFEDDFAAVSRPPVDRLVQAKRAGLPVVAEVRSAEDVDACALLADAFWVAGREMHHTSLLRRCAAARRPVFLERGHAATIDEWLAAAERLLVAGHEQVVLCEAGIRGSGGSLLDISAAPLARHLSHLPVIVDPGRAGMGAASLEPLAMASAAAGAKGVVIEVAPAGGPPLSTGEPALDVTRLGELGRKLTELWRAVGMGTS